MFCMFFICSKVNVLCEMAFFSEEETMRRSSERKEDSHFFSVNWCSRQDFPTPMSPGERRRTQRSEVNTLPTLSESGRLISWLVMKYRSERGAAGSWSYFFWLEIPISKFDYLLDNVMVNITLWTLTQICVCVRVCFRAWSSLWRSGLDWRYVVVHTETPARSDDEVYISQSHICGRGKFNFIFTNQRVFVRYLYGHSFMWIWLIKSQSSCRLLREVWMCGATPHSSLLCEG